MKNFLVLAGLTLATQAFATEPIGSLRAEFSKPVESLKPSPFGYGHGGRRGGGGRSGGGMSNAPGIISIGLGTDVGLGGATITPQGGTAQDGIGATANYYIRGQYGITDWFSAGLAIKYGGAVYVTTDEVGDQTALGVTGETFLAEAKFYAVNHPKFNFYFSPGIGFNTSTATEYNGGSSSGQTLGTGSLSGLSYSALVGINWYWVDFLGMSVNMGYSGTSLSGNITPSGGTAQSFTVSNTGFTFGIGLISKFGGN